MVKNQWVESGLRELSLGHWFDGYQILLGAYQRILRSNDPKSAINLLNEAVLLFEKGNNEDLACNLIKEYILGIRSKRTQREWVDQFQAIFGILRTTPLIACLKTVYSLIITERAFQDEEFLLHFNNIILEADSINNVIYDLYYCYAGLLCKKKQYVECYEALFAYSEEKSDLSPKIRCYLTLAEINAYEISSCGKFLPEENEDGQTTILDAKYIEITNSLFKSVEKDNELQFKAVLDSHSDLINSKEDILLKVLYEGINDIFSNNSSAGGLFSLFGG